MYAGRASFWYHSQLSTMNISIGQNGLKNPFEYSYFNTEVGRSKKNSDNQLKYLRAAVQG